MALLLSHKLLREPPTGFLESARQLQFDAAHESAVAAAVERLESRLSISLEPEDEMLQLGMVAGFSPARLQAFDVFQQALDGATGADARRAMLCSPDHVVVLDRAEQSEDRVDPRRLNAVMRRLDEGWQLRIPEPHGLDPLVNDMIDDLLVLHPAARSVLVYGIRSALGVGQLLEHPMLALQLAGVRSLMVSSADGSDQQRLAPGSLMYVPGSKSVSHLPLDAGSLHLEISLGPAADGDRPSAAMHPPRTWISVRAAHEVVAADPEAGWPMRLAAPGGVHVLTESADQVDLVVGAVQLSTTSAGADALLELESGGYKTGAAIAAAMGGDARDVVAFLEDLWEIGLVQPAEPVTAPASTGDRLTQVASADTAAERLHDTVLALIDDAAWRRPTAGEVHGADALDVHVQPLDTSDAAPVVRQVLETIIAMNAQFFAVETVGLHPNDPPLLVRVRPGPEAASPSSDQTRWIDLVDSDIRSNGTRKVTFVLSLTEADGGWIFLPAGSNTARAEAGALSCWVSLRPWLLEPLSAGERMFLLGRLHGSAFR